MTRKQEDLSNFNLLLKKAITEDETSNAAYSCIEDYQKAVEFGLGIRKKYDDNTYHEVTKWITKLLERAEIIKKIHKPLGPAPADANSLNKLIAKPKSNPIPKPVNKNPVTSGRQHQNMTTEEIQILKEVSTVNQNTFLPYVPGEELKENYKTLSPWEDPNYKMPISDSMKKIPGLFWTRIQDLYTNPVIYHPSLSAASLRQGSVGDCSLICSIAVSADYEFRRFKGNSPALLSKLVYPTNATSTNGKYFVTLNFNGCKRRVLIDDKIPVDPTGRMLTCTASCQLNPTDSKARKIFLPTLVEKAYMKMMGGYNFPGSNSGVDMYTLFGWIPERVNFTTGETIQVGTDHKEIKSDHWFDKMLYPRFQNGDCLITISTAQVIPENLKNLCIEDGHAYAVLDVRKTKNGNRMMKVKNPWAKDRFKGPWSPWDTKRWTKEMMNELGYDIYKARDTDDGIFWIDYGLSRYVFENLYLAWRPDKLFPNSTLVHAKWDNSNSPVKDRFFLTKNPQYKLSIRSMDQSTAEKKNSYKKTPIWLLLSRHITDVKDFEDNSVYLALMVFKNGRRIYGKTLSKPIIDGIRINSPHYLVKLTGIDCSEYSIVITQYENRGKSSYTLTAYSMAGVVTELTKIPDLETAFPHKIQYKGQWTAQTAGGCSNFRASFQNNPKIRFKLSNNTKFLCLQLKVQKEYSCGFSVKNISYDNPNLDPKDVFTNRDSGDYHYGYCVIECMNMPAGVYEIMPSTFNPGEIGPFFLEANVGKETKIAFL